MMAFPLEAYLKAMDFAARAHGSQTVPGTQLPYLLHLGKVVAELMPVAERLEAAEATLLLQAGLLHDTLEDTAVTEDQVEAEFGPQVLAMVRALSKNSQLPKAERMPDSLRRIRAVGALCAYVKVADRITNLAPPPAHWPNEKIAAYFLSSQLIYQELSPLTPLLAPRLFTKIQSYSAYFE